MISIVCYFLLFPVIFAFNASIYRSTDYYTKKNPAPVLTVESKYEFAYNLNAKLMMDILLKNKAPNVAATIYFGSINETNGDMAKKYPTKCKDGDCVGLKLINLKSKFVTIGVQLNRGTASCTKLIISEGHATSSVKPYLCVGPRYCVMVIDLQNECSYEVTDPKEQPQSTSTSSQNNVYIYVLWLVVVMCVILLVIYVTVKKFRNRSSNPEETLELNTYATTNEVLYADLSFVQGNNQPPRYAEESPYAQIIGVLHPKK